MGVCKHKCLRCLYRLVKLCERLDVAADVCSHVAALCVHILKFAFWRVRLFRVVTNMRLSDALGVHFWKMTKCFSFRCLTMLCMLDSSDYQLVGIWGCRAKYHLD